jgi:DNA adenine methylase
LANDLQATGIFFDRTLSDTGSAMTRVRMQQIASRKAKPFLKWAGGKTQLLAQFADHYPQQLAGGEITRYVEPFLGGGAVFLDVVQRFSIVEAVLFDINAELILAYRVVQKEPHRLIERLSQLHANYYALDDDQRDRYFYQIRDAYNAQRGEVDYHQFSKLWIERTALMIFLNKTCYNGLFRVNSRGMFNVPFGRYKRPAILDEQNILHVSSLLQMATLRVGPFQACEQHIDDRTFVYFDPPYRPISATSSFTSYSPQRFGEAEQIALSEFFALLDRTRKAKLMLSNSDPTHLVPDDDFFEACFAGYNIHRVHASRMINTNARKARQDPRAADHELLRTDFLQSTVDTLFVGSR